MSGPAITIDDLLYNNTYNIFIKDFKHDTDIDKTKSKEFINVLTEQLLELTKGLTPPLPPVQAAQQPPTDFDPKEAMGNLEKTYKLYNEIIKKQKEDTFKSVKFLIFKLEHDRLADINYKRYLKALEILQEKRLTTPGVTLEDAITPDDYNTKIMSIISDFDALKNKWGEFIGKGQIGLTNKKKTITKLITKWYPERVKYLRMLSNIRQGDETSLLEKLREISEEKKLDQAGKKKEMERLIYGFYLFLASSKNDEKTQKKINKMLEDAGLAYSGGGNDQNVWSYYEQLLELKDTLLVAAAAVVPIQQQQGGPGRPQPLVQPQAGAPGGLQSLVQPQAGAPGGLQPLVLPPQGGPAAGLGTPPTPQPSPLPAAATGTVEQPILELTPIVQNLVELTNANLAALNSLPVSGENTRQLAAGLTLQTLLNTLITSIQDVLTVKETVGDSNEQLNSAITTVIQDLVKSINDSKNPASQTTVEGAVGVIEKDKEFKTAIKTNIEGTISALLTELPATLESALPAAPVLTVAAEEAPAVEEAAVEAPEGEAPAVEEAAVEGEAPEGEAAVEGAPAAEQAASEGEAAEQAAAVEARRVEAALEAERQAAAALAAQAPVAAPVEAVVEEAPLEAPVEAADEAVAAAELEQIKAREAAAAEQQAAEAQQVRQAAVLAEAIQKREEAGSPPDTPMRPGEGFGKDKKLVSHPIYENPLALTARGETPIEEETSDEEERRRPIISMSDIALEKAKAAAAQFPPPSSSSTVASSSRLVAAPQSLTREQNDANIKREIGEAFTYFSKLNTTKDGRDKMNQLHEILEYINRDLNVKELRSDVPPPPVNPESKKAIILAFINANIRESINTSDNYYLTLTTGYNTFLKTLTTYQQNIQMSIIYEELLKSIKEKIGKNPVSSLITAFRSEIKFAGSISGRTPVGEYDNYNEKYIKELINIFGLSPKIKPLSWIDIISKPGETNKKNIPYYLELLGYNDNDLNPEILKDRYTKAKTYLELQKSKLTTEDNIRKFLNILKPLSATSFPPIGSRGGDLTDEELQKLTDILLMKGGAPTQETAKLTPEQMTAIVDKLREQQKLIRVIREDLNILRETYQTYSKSVKSDKEFKEDTAEIISLKDALAKAEAAAAASAEKTAKDLVVTEARRALKEKQDEQAKLNVFSDKEILGVNDYLKNNIEKIKKINLDTTGNVIKNINSLIQTITSVTKPLETREIFKANRLLLDFLLEGGEIDTEEKGDTNKLLIKKAIDEIGYKEQLKSKTTPEETPKKEIYKGFIPSINEIKRVFEQDIEYYKNVFQQQATGIEEEAKKQERALEKAKLEERERAGLLKRGGEYYQSGGLDKEKRTLLDNYLNVTPYLGLSPTNQSGKPGQSAPVETPVDIFKYLEAFEKILNNRYINKIADSSNPAYASIISGDKSTFNQLYEKYLKRREPGVGSEEDATNEMIQGLEMNNLIPREVLKVTLQDKVVFVFASLFIRLITLSVIEYLIEKSVVKTLVVAVLGYLGLFSIIFIAFVMLVNLDMYRLRIVFNYVNFHANSGNVYGYLILLWSFGLIIYYIMRSINTDSRTKSNNEESRVRLMYRIQIVSLIIWLFLVLMIAIM